MRTGYKEHYVAGETYLGATSGAKHQNRKVNKKTCGRGKGFAQYRKYGGGKTMTAEVERQAVRSADFILGKHSMYDKSDCNQTKRLKAEAKQLVERAIQRGEISRRKPDEPLQA